MCVFDVDVCSEAAIHISVARFLPPIFQRRGKEEGITRKVQCWIFYTPLSWGRYGCAVATLFLFIVLHLNRTGSFCDGLKETRTRQADGVFRCLGFRHKTDYWLRFYIYMNCDWTWAGIPQSVLRLATGWSVKGSNTCWSRWPEGLKARVCGGSFAGITGSNPGAHSASYTMDTDFLSRGVKRPGRGVNEPPPSSAKVKERVELYYSSLSGPSWPALRCNLRYFDQVTEHRNVCIFTLKYFHILRVILRINMINFLLVLMGMQRIG